MIEEVKAIAKEAGSIILHYYNQNRDQLNIKTKSDEFDFVTVADQKADDFIRSALAKEFPDDLILSEESNNIPKDFTGNVWMVDPLDGTKEFVYGGDSFSVMIGLCKDGIPVLGVVYWPTKDTLYYAQKGKGAYVIHNSKTNTTPKEMHVSTVNKISNAHIVKRFQRGNEQELDPIIESIKTKAHTRISSVGIRTGLVCEARADFNIMGGPKASKWDTCAPQIILEEAGGKITDLDGNPLNYKQESLKWKKAFTVSNGYLHEEIIELTKGHLKDN